MCNLHNLKKTTSMVRSIFLHILLIFCVCVCVMPYGRGSANNLIDSLLKLPFSLYWMSKNDHFNAFRLVLINVFVVIVSRNFPSELHLFALLTWEVALHEHELHGCIPPLFLCGSSQFTSGRLLSSASAQILPTSSNSFWHTFRRSQQERENVNPRLVRSAESCSKTDVSKALQTFCPYFKVCWVNIWPPQDHF